MYLKGSAGWTRHKLLSSMPLGARTCCTVAAHDSQLQWHYGIAAMAASEWGQDRSFSFTRPGTQEYSHDKRALKFKVLSD